MISRRTDDFVREDDVDVKALVQQTLAARGFGDSTGVGGEDEIMVD